MGSDVKNLSGTAPWTRDLCSDSARSGASLNVLEQIRRACKAVAEEATYVRIYEERIASYAASLPLERAVSPELDPCCHYLGHGEDTAAFFVTLDTVNFGSGYFPYLRKRPGMSGYFTVASSLNDHFVSHGPFTSAMLREITPADCGLIFNQDLTVEPVAELVALFSQALNDLGTYLIGMFDGSFLSLIAGAGGKAERLVEILSAMPFFNDVESYKGRQVPFFKRAQIMAADLSLAFHGKGPGRFDDLSDLTIFADNLVPHVLRLDGILAYDRGLADRIDREELILAGSHEEVEIRASAVHAVELMREGLASSGVAVTSMGLDHILWNRGQQRHYKETKPRHRTRTVYY